MYVKTASPYAVLVALAMLAVVMAGCVQPVQKLGCCLKENATSEDPASRGCMLYNTTNYQVYDYKARTNGLCDHEAATPDEVDTQGLCNVSIPVGTGSQDFLIPICTQDDIVKCIDGNCTAMVCGDFVFKPRVAPGFANTASEDTGASVSGAVPTETKKSTVTQFYKAQCRFLPMDAKLRGVMKNSKSQINVFRMGVGGSFDEFDQYRYYFPIADKYCNINQPAQAGQILVDRYMNYAPGWYVPAISNNCINGVNDPAMLSFHETAAAKTASTVFGSITYNPVLPDLNNYRFEHVAQVDLFPTLSAVQTWVWVGYPIFGYVWKYLPAASWSTVSSSAWNISVFKKLDERYYRRALSITHVTSIYGIFTATARAPFECDSTANDCYSGSCSTQTYSRSALLTYSQNPATAKEVVADCVKTKDTWGMDVVVCAPTKQVTTGNLPGDPPFKTYASGDFRVANIYANTRDANPAWNPIYEVGFLPDGNEMNGHWKTLAGNSTPYKEFLPPMYSTGLQTRTYYTKGDFQIQQRKDCPWDYGVNTGTDEVWCSTYTDSYVGPPVTGAVFFGKTGDKQPTWGSGQVIGYAISKPGQFEQTLLAKNCNLVQGKDYVVMNMGQPLGWTGFMDAWTPYFEARVKAMKTTGVGDPIQAYDAVVASMPWVIGYHKRESVKHLAEGGGFDENEYQAIDIGQDILTSIPAETFRKYNLYDEPVLTTAASTSAQLSNLRSEDIDQPGHHIYSFRYYAVYSEYFYMLLYTPGSNRIGDCAVDDNTYMPETRTFGWCEPCTTSTLAYQNITSYGASAALATSGCNTVKDEVGLTKIVCQKKSSDVPQTSPERTYPRVAVIPYHLQVDYKPGVSGVTNNNAPTSRDVWRGSLQLDRWETFSSVATELVNLKGVQQTIINSTDRIYFDQAMKMNCADYPPNSDRSLVLCSNMQPSRRLPPVGGAVFFGKTMEPAGTPGRITDNVAYEGSTIIGYALATPGDFNELSVVKECQLGPGDFTEVELSGPGDPAWQALMDGFRPYYEKRIKAMAAVPGGTVQPYDLVVSSIPWVVNYQKGANATVLGYDVPIRINYVSEHLSSTAGQAYVARNGMAGTVLTGNPLLRNTSVRALRDTTVTTLPDLIIQGVGQYHQVINKSYYNLAFSRYVYLFKYVPGSGKLGSCRINDTTYMPLQKNYSCTSCGTGCSVCETTEVVPSTANPNNRSVYLPYLRMNVDGANFKNLEIVCTPGTGSSVALPPAVCSNPHVTDISEYSSVLTTTGAPKTIPEATIVKERLGNYLKSGVMPVLDLSDGTNWNRHNPISDIRVLGVPVFMDNATLRNYKDYDFERLFGNMGAAIVIVDHVGSAADADAKLERIIDRSGIVREKCAGCLIAFHVDSPATNLSLESSARAVLSDPRANFNIDMVTFDYSVSQHPHPSITNLVNKSKAIVNDMASYGRASLAAGGKPTMIVGFSVNTADMEWYGNYGTLFDTIVRGQEDLIKAGITGIIYSPVRGGANGLIDVQGDGIGRKTDRFCALEGALEKLSIAPPVAIFQRILAQDVTCTACSSLDYINGACNLASTAAQLQCDDGRQCQVPQGMLAGEVKCPSGVVTQDCRPCTSSTKTYTCTYHYTNGTVKTVGPRPISELNSDVYSDIIAGLPKPEKCCITDPGSGANFSYTKETHQNPINKPLVFAKVGDPNIDCGMGSGMDALDKLGSFCGYSLPLKQYDLNCTVSG